jgi:hypothetical protein
MNKSFLISIGLILYCSVVFAQNSINSYKYILVPKQFEFQSSADQYQINSLTKFLFNKAGFTTFYTDDQFPGDLASNRCLSLKAVIKNNSGMFKTKIIVNFIDCNNKVVYSTAETFSKNKDFKKAYHDAIRKNFVEIEELNYTYTAPKSKLKEAVKEEKRVVTEPLEVTQKEEKVVKTKVAEQKVEKLTKQFKNVKVENKRIVVEKLPKKTTSLHVKPTIKSILGTFLIGKWGACKIIEKNENYTVLGGDENFEFAVIYKTSKPNFYIIKWTAYKQPQLLQLDSDGNLKVDLGNGVITYTRID